MCRRPGPASAVLFPLKHIHPVSWSLYAPFCFPPPPPGLKRCRIVKGPGKRTKIDVPVVVVKQQLFLRSIQAVKWFSVYVLCVHGFVESYTVNAHFC